MQIRSAETASETEYKSQPFAFTALTSLFFLWGFLTCLNDILVPHLRNVFSLNYTQAAFIQFTFFAAYFVISLPAGFIIHRIGYQKGIVLGLALAATGAFAFYPAAALPSYGIFLTALFTLASGITILQVAANPYVSILGPPETASSRLNLSQAFNSLGTTVAPYLGGMFIFASATHVFDPGSLSGEALDAWRQQEASSVQGPYLFLGSTLLVMAVVFYSLRLPKVDSGSSVSVNFAGLFSISHLRWGVLGIFLYVGAEVSIGTYLVNFLGDENIAGLQESQAASLVSWYWGGAMAGRFVGSALMQKIKPGLLLGWAAVGAGFLGFTAATTSGSTAMIAVLSIGIFNSIMFPTIFTLSIRELGARTGEASSLLVMAIVGGAILPLITGSLADAFTLQTALMLPALCYAYIAWFGWRGSAVSGS